ncbi:MAG TPA: hypothetical protein V6C52_12540 [Coleofasciculaceae cyanobacterium]|jgi:hypothetical protein
MNQQLFQPEHVASEWAARICDRLQELNLPDDELNEMRTIIYTFTKTAAEELTKEQQITLPYTDQTMGITPQLSHQIIELFIRGVNQTAKKLRETGKNWDDRKVILEVMAWKLFNLSKLLVGFLEIPNPALQSLLTNSKDLQLMMKQSADVLLQEELTGKKMGDFPFNMKY